MTAFVVTFRSPACSVHAAECVTQVLIPATNVVVLARTHDVHSGSKTSVKISCIMCREVEQHETNSTTSTTLTPSSIFRRSFSAKQSLRRTQSNEMPRACTQNLTQTKARNRQKRNHSRCAFETFSRKLV